jgi:hypothetical protein
MPIHVTRDDSTRRFTAVGEGTLTAADILGFMAEHRVGSYRPYGLLFDIRNADLQVSAADVRGFAERTDPLTITQGPRGPVAIVATQPAIYGLSRMYETLADLRQLPPFRTFQDSDDAIAWLDAMRPG